MTSSVFRFAYTLLRLGDFKRTASKEWMIIKFGSILEAAEKSTIVGELGKLVIEVGIRIRV